MEAVIATGGKQYRVTPGAVIAVEKVAGDKGAASEALKAAQPEITEAMIAERAYHIALSGDGTTDEENWLRAERELRNA